MFPQIKSMLNWANLNDTMKNNSCVTSKLPIIKKKLPCDNRISCRQIFTMYSFILKLFTVTGNNLVEMGLVAKKFIPNYQSLFFKLTQLA